MLHIVVDNRLKQAHLETDQVDLLGSLSHSLIVFFFSLSLSLPIFGYLANAVGVPLNEP